MAPLFVGSSWLRALATPIDHAYVLQSPQTQFVVADSSLCD
jgi:hypothetical protein